MARTRLNEQQIKFEDIFSVERILAARGYSIIEHASHVDTLLEITAPKEAQLEDLFQRFDSAEKRAQEYGLIIQGARNRYNEQRTKYSTTFEWYVGALLVKKFKAFSASFGVKVRNIYRPENEELMGDFDVLVVLGDLSLLYVECKTGALRSEEISKAIERSHALSTIATVIVYDKKSEGAKIRDLIGNNIYPGFKTDSPALSEIKIKNLENSNVLVWNRTYFVCSN